MVNHKTHRLAAFVQSWQGSELEAHYLGFFECFNRQQFFEAHEVLEALWLVRRGTPRDLFYKGLIQLAGAFVHVQKNRPQPASALLEQARGNLQPYGPFCDRLNVAVLIERIGGWLRCVQAGNGSGLLGPGQTPFIELQSPRP